MDKKRAEEIMRAPTKIEVVHNGEPVWIEGIDETSADVTVLGTSETRDVPLEELQETGKYEMRLNR
ncbi:MAG: H-type small acid-soluble spore protein [Bacillota bacterium]|nr:H-type small acid-soluble spore protein [Bacillota bacterium]MDW7685081.1 H-type small acid-soluble spore protein [Bacillota bacterium]